MDEQYNILDFETTGFSADFDRVIEVGVIKINNNEIVDTFQTLVNPGLRISSTITNLTGITNEMVKDAPKNSLVMPKLQAFVGEELIVAHNASFDERFFKTEMKRSGLKVKNQFLCSLLLARRIYQSLDSHKLEVICRHLGLINVASHRAIGDAEVTHKVLNDICDQIKRHSWKNQISPQYLAKLSKIPKKNVQSWLRS